VRVRSQLTGSKNERSVSVTKQKRRKKAGGGEGEEEGRSLGSVTEAIMNELTCYFLFYLLLAEFIVCNYFTRSIYILKYRIIT